jgi:hypothetical protein
MSKGEKGWAAGKEPQHHHNMKSEQADVRNVEWERQHHCQQARQQQHNRRPRGGSDMQTRNGNLIIVDLAGSTRHARRLGLQQAGSDIRSARDGTGRRSSKMILTTPKRTLATAISLWGRTKEGVGSREKQVEKRK